MQATTKREVARAAVQWESVPQTVYDDLVSVLLGTLHPEAERIDDRGGDGGRDVQIREDEKLTIFELKSFTGRLGNAQGRRQQVQSSLARAAGLDPSSWELVVPIDHTPAELQWFDGLRASYPFPLAWRGRTWLEQQLAQHPAIVRYYLEDRAQEVIRLLTQLHQEQAALANGVPDVLDRLTALRDRIDELDPHYRLDIAMNGDTTTVTVRTRYKGADRDRPIRVTGTFEFPDTEVGRELAKRLEDAFDFGEPVEIPADYTGTFQVDAPAGLGGEFAGAAVTLGAAVNPNVVSLDGRMQIFNPDGRPLGTLPIRFDEHRLGNAGGTMVGRDSTGSIELSVRLDVRSSRAVGTYHLQPASGLLPGALLPLLRFADRLRAPNLVQIRFDGHDLGPPMELPDGGPSQEGLISLLEDLERVQIATLTPFPVPDEFEVEDVNAIRVAAALLAGEQVPLGDGDFAADLTITGPGMLVAWAENTEPQAVAIPVPNYTVSICGVEVSLGRAVIYMAAATIANAAEIAAASPNVGDHASVIIRPESGVMIEARLLSGT